MNVSPAKIDERLAGEERLAHERHHPLHSRLVLRRADAGGVTPPA
jgi:hypothetical protein